MTMLNYAKNRVALIIAGSATAVPTYFQIGSGSGTVAITQTNLFNPVDSQAATTINGTTSQIIKFTGDWSSAEMNGITLREWGITFSGVPVSGTTGSMWSKTVIPAIVFDGTNELRIEETWQVF